MGFHSRLPLLGISLHNLLCSKRDYLLEADSKDVGAATYQQFAYCQAGRTHLAMSKTAYYIVFEESRSLHVLFRGKSHGRRDSDVGA